MTAGTMSEFVRLPSGVIVRAHDLTACFPAARPKAVDLFCGAGGMSLGLVQAGYQVVAAVDADPLAIMTYMVNLCRCGEVTMHFVDPQDRCRTEKAIEREFRRQVTTAGSGWIAGEPRSVPGVGHIIVGDVRRLTGARMLGLLGLQAGKLDLVAGGPPCQGFSMAGKRKPDDPRNSLVFEFARLALELKPTAVVMENVAAIATMTTPDGLPVIDALCRVLEDGGFGGLDAFRRAVAGAAGAAGAIRAKRSRSRAAVAPGRTVHV